MKMSKLALSAMIASACCAGTAFGQSNRTAPRYYPASYYSYNQTGATAAPASPVVQASSCESTPACDVAAICDGKGSSCDGMSACGCGTSSCDGGCGSGCGSGGLLGLGILGGDCCLGEPFKLVPDGIAGINVGGWTSVGYHSHANPLSFNTYDGRVQLQQQWFFAEKVADGSEGIGFGARVDYL